MRVCLNRLSLAAREQKRRAPLSLAICGCNRWGQGPAGEIPPMLLQPYIENAVWHGLRYKESKGHLALNIRKNSHGLEVEIKDDGIGRKRSAELKTENQKKHHSTGIKNIEERLRIINKVYRANYAVKIRDLDPVSGYGTQVLISIPEHKNGKS
jgi:sensor histidine kinase YesM